MITLEQALQRISPTCAYANQCHEYRDAYIFCRDDDITIGGYDESPVIVMKYDGSIQFDYASFLEENHELIRSIKVR